MLVDVEPLKASLSNVEPLKGELNRKVEYIAPTTQEKVVKPTLNQQVVLPDENVFALSKVVVEAIESEELNVTPNVENQEYIGMYNKVVVAGDENLKPENLPKGLEIFGVIGSSDMVNLEEYFDLDYFNSSTATYDSYGAARMLMYLPYINIIDGRTSINNLFSEWRGLK